jgi:hypothetical protein
MAGTKVHLFPPISSLTPTTQLYTQRRSSAEAPANFRLTLADIAAWLEEQGFLKLPAPGPYVDDDAAGAAGVAVGEYYELAIPNTYGIPVGNGGILKKRIE